MSDTTPTKPFEPPTTSLPAPDVATQKLPTTSAPTEWIPVGVSMTTTATASAAPNASRGSAVRSRRSSPPPSPSSAALSGPDKADCPDTSRPVDIAWCTRSANPVDIAWFGIGTNNANAEPFDSVPTTVTCTFTDQCSEASQLYTVTLEDSAGRLTYNTVEFVRQ